VRRNATNAETTRSNPTNATSAPSSRTAPIPASPAQAIGNSSATPNASPAGNDDSAARFWIARETPLVTRLTTVATDTIT
jgi:hypothetical protein